MEEMNYGVSEEVATPQEDTGMDIDTTEEFSEGIDDSVEDLNENIEIEGANEEVADSQERQVQTPEQNAIFAKMRRENEARVREAEIRARDNMIAEMGMEWNGRPITNYAEYQKAVEEKKLMEEAEQRGYDPNLYAEMQMMRREVDSYRRASVIAQQEHELSSDPVKGDLYNSWKYEIRELADKHNCDLNTAFSVMLTERIEEVLAMNQQKIQNETINKINENQTSTPGALGSANEQPSLDAWSMSDADFEKMKARALNGELRR